jgi:hypothetical protein
MPNSTPYSGQIGGYSITLIVGKSAQSTFGRTSTICCFAVDVEREREIVALCREYWSIGAELTPRRESGLLNQIGKESTTQNPI